MDKELSPRDLNGEEGSDQAFGCVNDLSLVQQARLEVENLDALAGLVSAQHHCEVQLGNALLDGVGDAGALGAELLRLEEKVRVGVDLGQLPDFLLYDQRKSARWLGSTLSRAYVMREALEACESAEQRLKEVLAQH